MDISLPTLEAKKQQRCPYFWQTPALKALMCSMSLGPIAYVGPLLTNLEDQRT